MLVVDQFEEVFTVCRDERERTAFLDALVDLSRTAIGRPGRASPMRADFYGHCAAARAARPRWSAPTRCSSARCAATSCGARSRPAERAGLSVEPALTDALIADVLDEPGGLPLLSAALLEQWREREGRVMRHAAYERTGGVRGAVGRLAERTYAQLSEPSSDAARADPAAAGRRRRA